MHGSDVRTNLHKLAAEETKQENTNSLLLPEEKVASPQVMTDVVQNQTPETLLDPNLSPEVKNAAVNIMNELDAVKPTPQPDTTQLFINGVNGNVDRIIDSRGKPKPQLETATPDADTAQLIDLFKSGLNGKRQTPVPTTPTDNVTQAFFDGLNSIRRNTDTTAPTTEGGVKAIVENEETDAAEAASDSDKRVDIDEAVEEEYNDSSRTKEQQVNAVNEHSKAFFTKNDPARDYLGSATESHPQEIKSIIDKLNALGIKIIYRQGVMAYQPNPCSGHPGQIVIDPDASYLAWRHEERHAIDDYEAGWRGFRFFTDPHKAALLEKAAYNLEIHLANELEMPDLAKKLDALKREEMGEYYE